MTPEDQTSQDWPTFTAERMIDSPGDASPAQLCTQAVGDPGDPAVLLLAGAACSMDFWSDGLCRRLAAGTPDDGGRYVIRYDPRDTGRSTSWPVGQPGYDGHDLVADVLAVLDAHDLDAAHLVGMSMGAGVALLVALDHAERVASLTLQSTTAGGDDLPPPSDAILATFDDPGPEPDWDDHASVVAHVVDGERPYAGTLGFDEERIRGIAERVVERTDDVAATLTNHFAIDQGPPVRDRLGEVTVPTLVVHGTADPLFPIDHGEVLADEIPRARLLRLDGVGHQYPPPSTWEQFLPALLDHTAP